MKTKDKLIIGLSIGECIICVIAGWQLRKITYERLKSKDLILKGGVFDTK